MLLRKVKFGDVVYCDDTQQAYMVEGWNYKQDKLCLKNLTNIDAPLVRISPDKLREIPDNWVTKTWYEHLAKTIVDKRKSI